MSDPQNKEFECLYLVTEEDLEKINKAEKPFLSYTQIYNSVVNAGKNNTQPENSEKGGAVKKKKLIKWLLIDSPEDESTFEPSSV